MLMLMDFEISNIICTGITKQSILFAGLVVECCGCVSDCKQFAKLQITVTSSSSPITIRVDSWSISDLRELYLKVN